MVLGNNLNECLTELTLVLDQVIGTVTSMLTHSIALDAALAAHIHPVGGAPGFTAPSVNMIPLNLAQVSMKSSKDLFSTVAEKWNLVRNKMGFLERGGKMSIRSRYNNVN